MIGKVFGYLTVISDAATQRAGRWEVECVCGTIVERTTTELGKVRSCGCMKGAPRGCIQPKQVVSSNDPKVIWKPIPSLDGYEASDRGEIRNVHSKGLIASYVTRRGYRTHYFRKGVSNVLHRHIAEAFLGPPFSYEVNHKDGNKLNNRPDNLEYTTRSGNIQHAYDTGLRKRVQPPGRNLGCRKST